MIRSVEELPASFIAKIKPLTLIPDEYDIKLHRKNCRISLMTRRMRSLTPLLEFADFLYEEISPGYAVGTIPLKASTMNQNGTQQAAIFFLLADCTAGAAVLSTLPGIYVVGLHDRCHAQPVQMWLRGNEIKYLRAGTGRLRAVARVKMEDVTGMRSELITNGRAQMTVEVEIYQQKLLVATSTALIAAYLDNPRGSDREADRIQQENAKISAKLIAGLRQHRKTQLVAGEQGRALADRFTKILPPLPRLIEARSKSLQHYLESSSNIHHQVVVLGVGLDMRPADYAGQNQLWYGLDLEIMIQERRNLAEIAEVSDTNPQFHLVPADLRLNNWVEILLEHGFDDKLSTLFILEGVSMYLSTTDLKKLLEMLHLRCRHPKNKVWLDHINPAIFALPIDEVQDFLAIMSRLGEPIISGFRSIENISKLWRTENMESSYNVLGKPSGYEDLYINYNFSTLAIQDPDYMLMP